MKITNLTQKNVFHKRRRPILHLIFGILSLGAFLWTLYFYTPSSTLTIPYIPFTLPIIPLFFILLLAALFFLTSYIFKSSKHGILVSLFVGIYLIFRLNNLTHPFFFILLFALFLTLELLVSYRK